MAADAPRVFVSYAYDSAEHSEQVLKFATYLREVGIDPRLDAFETDRRRDWYAWSLQEINAADFVVVVASEKYRAIDDGDDSNSETRGPEEAKLLREILHRDGSSWLPKILPVILPGHTANEIPLFLQPSSATHFIVTSFDAAGMESIIRVILGQPRRFGPDADVSGLPHDTAETGEVPQLPPAQAVNHPVSGDPGELVEPDPDGDIDEHSTKYADWHLVDVPSDAEDLYQNVPPSTQLLLRRTCLFESGDILDMTTARLLLPGFSDEDVADAYASLVKLQPELPWVSLAHHLAEDPPQLVTNIRYGLRRHRIERNGAAPRPHITRDYWTTDDHLEYRPYADAIATFIRHPDSKPPLTIGIKGPWGAGKTSLMRMIKKELDDDRKIELTVKSRRKIAKRRRAEADTPVTNAELLKNTTTPSGNDQLDLERPGSTWRATVWFSPWMYQSTEQVWAGLAHAIISQVTDRLRPGDRERFWLELNLARLDRLAVRRRLYRLFLERLLPVLVTFALTAGVAAILWVTGVAMSLARWTIAGGAGIMILGGIVQYLGFRTRPAIAGFEQLLSGPAKGLLDEAAPEPGYASKAGFLHLVQHDMARVLSLVATEKRPLVVFIDDLDRCSPGVVAEVIEAVNLFLAGEFENCVFVVAMEPDVLAAHVEVAYADLVQRLGTEGGELGWRFLEKIVQLPMSLPPVDEERHVNTYLRALLNIRDEPTSTAADPDTQESSSGAGAATSQEVIAEGGVIGGALHAAIVNAMTTASTGTNTRARALAGIRALRPTVDTLAQVVEEVISDLVRNIAGLTAEGAQVIALEAAEEVYSDLYTDQVALTAIEAAMPVLRSANPREVKRYINLYRFYSFITFRRRAAGETAPNDAQLAKLVAFAIRWPDLLGSGGPALMRLEEAVHDDITWETSLDDLGRLKNSPGRRTALRAFLAADPKVGAVAHIVL